MKWYLQNLQCGLRTACFFPTPQRFVGSWHALMAIVATTVLSQILLEFAVDGKGGGLAESCEEYLACLFSFTIITAYILGFSSRDESKVLDVAVAFLNSYYFIFLPYAFMYIFSPEKFNAGGFSTFAREMICVWAFLVMFRLASVLWHEAFELSLGTFVF